MHCQQNVKKKNWKPVAESAIETNWYRFILCFKYALLVLVSAIAFLTGGVHQIMNVMHISLLHLLGSYFNSALNL